MKDQSRTSTVRTTPFLKFVYTASIFVDAGKLSSSFNFAQTLALFTVSGIDRVYEEVRTSNLESESSRLDPYRQIEDFQETLLIR